MIQKGLIQDTQERHVGACRKEAGPTALLEREITAGLGHVQQLSFLVHR